MANGLESRQDADAVHAFIESLRNRGVRLWSDGERLRYTARKGVLARGEIEKLGALKAEIIPLLGNTAEDNEHRPDPAASPRRGAAPLTFCQMAQWRSHQLSRRPSYRAVATAIRISGPLNVDALAESVVRIEDRHGALRTRIVVLDGVPMQEICESAAGGLQTCDLTALLHCDREIEIRRHIAELILEPIDFAAGPLYAVRLLKLATDAEHVLIVVLEHLISDGFSLDILMTELFQAYEQVSRNRPVAWSTTSMQIADYAVWQRSSHEAWLRRHDTYWKARLAGCGRVKFPESRPLSRTPREGWGCVPLQFGSEMRSQLGTWCRAHRTTVAMSVFTAFVAVVSRWCTVADAVFRYQINGRVSSKVTGTIGYFASRLHLRIDLGGKLNFVGLMQRIIKEYDEALEHADLSYLETLEPIPEFARNAIFNWMSQANEVDVCIASGAEGALRIEPIPFANPAFEKLEWDNEPMVILVDTGVEVAGGIYFPRTSLSQDTMELFARNFLRFVDYLLTTPEATVRDCALV